MKAAVFSDTHSNTALMVEAVGRYRPDVIIHLGDHERDTEILRRKYPEIPLYSVCGNCDYGSQGLLADVVPLGPVKAYITHGHTHRADNREIGGVKVVNPGTAGMSRKPTWALITVFDNGGIAVEIRDL